MLAPSFRHCWARLFDFDGRTPRELFLPYVNWVLVPIVAVVVAMAIGPFGLMPGSFGTARPAETSPSGAGMLLLAVFVVGAGLVLTSAATVRRLHDVGKSGWWFALPTLLLLLKEVAWIDVATSPMVDQAKVGSVTLLTYGLRLLDVLAGYYLLQLLRRPGQATRNRYGSPLPDEPSHDPSGGLEAARVEAAFARLASSEAPQTARADQLDRASPLFSGDVDTARETARETARVDAAFARLAGDRSQSVTATPRVAGFGRKRR